MVSNYFCGIKTEKTNPQIFNVDDQQGHFYSSYRAGDGIVILEGEWEVIRSVESNI